jgi:hypothetical protein
MLKWTIKYLDFNDRMLEETLYFNLTLGELAKMELSAPGNSFRAYLQQIIQAEDGKKVIEAIEFMLKTAWGERSDDGRHFYKTDLGWNNFTSTAAYSALFYELVTEADKASAFINGLMPKNAPKSEAHKVVEEVSGKTLRAETVVSNLNLTPVASEMAFPAGEKKLVAAPRFPNKLTQQEAYKLPPEELMAYLTVHKGFAE